MGSPLDWSSDDPGSLGVLCCLPAVQYYAVICDRFTDRGVSVRKRAIKIVRGLCLQAQGFEHAVDACARIFSRFNDEEASIRVSPLCSVT